MATRIANQQADDTLRRVNAYLGDLEREAREAALQCKTCWYFRRGGLAGQAFTEWSCGICTKEGTHPNTATPRVCRDCADKHHLCTRCGGDIRMWMGRRKFPDETLKDGE